MHPENALRRAECVLASGQGTLRRACALHQYAQCAGYRAIGIHHDHASRSAAGSTPQWLWSHVNSHEVHHKYPYLAHEYLPQAFEASRHHSPYLVVDGYRKSLLNVRRPGYYGTQEAVRPT